MRKYLIILIYLFLFFFNSCRKEELNPIILLNNALLYRTESEEVAVSEKNLYRGDRVKIKAQTNNHYYVFSPRLNVAGYIRKKYVLNEPHSIGTVVSQGKLNYADGTVLIPFEASLPLNTRVFILGEHKNWYIINYQGGQRFYIEKQHIIPGFNQPGKTFNIEGIGDVFVTARFQDLSIIGSENDNSIDKMFDDKPDTFFLSGEYKGSEVIEIKLPDKMRVEVKIINGSSRSLPSYKSYGRLYKLNVETDDNEKKNVTLRDGEMDFQTVGLFYTNIIRININKIFQGNDHKGFAIGAVSLKRIDGKEFDIYNELLVRRKSIFDALGQANREIKNKDFRKAIYSLEKAQKELPVEAENTYINIGIKLAAFRIYFEKLNDFVSAENCLDSLLYLSEKLGNIGMYDLSRTPYSDALTIDINGLNIFFREIKYRHKEDYAFPSIYLKSHLYYLAGNFYLARNHITASLDYFKKILLDTRKYKAYRSTNNINYYSKLVVDKLINNYPADIIYRFLKQEIIPNYRLGLDEREDENYIFYIMGNLSENLRNREEALFFYKQCEKISDNYNAAEKPFSHTLSLKRLREMGARF